MSLTKWRLVQHSANSPLLKALRPYSASSVFALLIFGWMATGVVSGSLAQFDQESAALVHQLATPATTVLMRVASTVGARPKWSLTSRNALVNPVDFRTIVEGS
jgi:hypothetical protein